MTIQLLCAALAFILGAIAIYVDFYQVVQKKIPFVPRQIFRSLSLFFLALTIGAAAAAIFYFTPAQPGQTGNYVDVVFGSHIDNPFLRAVYTGAAVLAILRSRIFDLKKSGFGFDWAYAQIKSRILPGMFASWWAWQDGWLTKAVPESFAIPDFDKRLGDRVAQVLSADDDGSKTDIKGQLDALTSKTPPLPIVATDQAWLNHRQALCQLAMESCGDRVFKGLLSV
jgi:hypothetical protein